VLLEHEPEAASLLEAVDLGPQVSAQGGVLDLVKEDVEFASDHAVSLSVGRAWWLGTTASRFADPDRPLANRSARGSDRLFVIPSSSNPKCLVGSANCEFRIGFSITTRGKQGPSQDGDGVGAVSGYAAGASARVAHTSCCPEYCARIRRDSTDPSAPTGFARARLLHGRLRRAFARRGGPRPWQLELSRLFRCPFSACRWRRSRSVD
jgi:hypothetical protein